MDNIKEYFTSKAFTNKLDPLSINFAENLDENDILNSYRHKFHFPKSIDNQNSLYFNGNSLGLMPKKSQDAINMQLEKWANRASEGHNEEPLPWLTCDEYLVEDMSMIVGAKKEEIALMNQLSVNLHLMLVSFYRPTKIRNKIFCEYQAFPSDRYAFESQIEWHGYDPKTCLLTIKPRENEEIIRTDDIIKFINKNGENISLICFSGVQYLTGQLFEIEKITRVGKDMGCYVGWDLAHAVGNVPLKLHDWKIDFAVWCSYKYLNSGPGGIGGIFVHEEQLKFENTPYLRGWWGHRVSDRMEMYNDFSAAKGALKYRLSNTSFTNCVLLQTSLEIFREIGMEKLREKSIILTNYFQFLLNSKIDPNIFEIITPMNEDERGSQLSLKILIDKSRVQKVIQENNVFCDYRHGLILRLSPCAMYNSFLDVFKLVEILANLNVIVSNEN